MPDYAGRVVFVDAVTDDPAAAAVVEQYPTQYIPTSVFVDSSGEVADTVIGPLSAEQLRDRLDALIGADSP